MHRLFRREAIDTQRHRLLGNAIVSQPLSFAVLTIFLVIIIIAITVFISLGSYARKETVTGFLSPDKGIVKVHAPRSGVIGKLHAHEGLFVKAGTPLFTLLGEKITGSGIAVDSGMLEALDVQLSEIEVRKSLEKQRKEAEEERLSAKISGLESEHVAIAAQIRVQKTLLDRLQTNYDRMRNIAEQGYISNQDYMRWEENLLSNKQMLAALSQKRANSAAQIRQAELAMQHLPLEVAERQSKLASVQADLVLKKLELAGRQSITIAAPIAGKVTALQAASGASVNTQLPLLTILPEGGTLEAHLFVPTRAIGFIKIGQQVRLLYDAFDYRRFGVHIGIVSAISSAVFLPAETQASIRITEPAYRVTVQIEKQTVDGYGQQMRLQSGMLLKADIVLEKRSLMQWLLGPIVSLRGRT